MEFFLEHPMLVTYLFLKLDSFMSTFTLLTVLYITALCLWSLFYAVELSKVAPHLKKLTALAVLLVSITTLVPSSKEVAIMYGVSTGVTVVKGIATSPITEKSLELLNIYVEKELDKAKNSLEKSK